MKAEEEVINILAGAGVNLVVTLPCEKIKRLLNAVPRRFKHVSLTREEEGVGICAGAYLAGKRAAMLIQSSGVGNIVNALCSLTKFYQLALPILVSWRGVYKESIDAQVSMGQCLPGLSSALGVPCTEIHARKQLPLLGDALREAFEKETPYLVLLSPRIWGSDGEENPLQRRRLRARSYSSRALSPTLTRYQVLKVAAPYLRNKAVVCNLGYPCKELYQIMDQGSNFYMLGSMGMCSPIALGIAMNTDKEVVAIEGDGSLLMNPGVLATIALVNPCNLTILAIDNAAYGSTGNQPTATSSVADLEMIARGFGIETTFKAADREEIEAALRDKKSGPRFIHVIAKPGNARVPNIPLGALEIKRRVMEFLRT
jgi:sulfopyruvate decarboxylase subunit beta